MLCATPFYEHKTTHPSLVTALVELLEEEGASKVYVGDISGDETVKNNTIVAEQCGILSASKGTFLDISKDIVYVNVGLKRVDPIGVSRLAMQVDEIINVAKFKTHCRTFITASIKNLFGLVCHKDRQRIHQKYSSSTDFAYAIAKIYTFFNPLVNIVDSIIAMEGNGPISNELKTINKLLISREGYALDSILAKMTNVLPEQIPLIVEAKKQQQNKCDFNDIIVDNEFDVLTDFKMPTTFYSKEFDSSKLPLFGKNPFDLILQTELCIKCGICANRCPANAIQLNSYPNIDQEKCINCFCCHELCPNHAWIL